MKRYCINIIKKLKNYAKSNILFIFFIGILVLLEITLRFMTVGSGISYFFKSLFVDIAFALLIGAFAYLIKSKNRYIYYLFWIVFLSILCVVNAIYYEFYESYISVNLISTASMIGEVNDALFEKIYIYHFIYLLYPILFIIVHRKLKKNGYFDRVNTSLKYMFRKTICASLIIVLLIGVTLNKTELSRFVKQWNREYIVQKFGLYLYTINDLVQSIQPKIDTLFGYDESAKKFREYYACEFEQETKTNKYTNIFKGKNVIFIHMESIQNFLIGLKINGKEVTPNLNRIVSEGIYFSKFYPQISVGTSSDTEFTLNTGLMPSSSGTVFVNFFNRYYNAMPEEFKKAGYYTFSMHANNADYWNRKTMHKNLGYNDFYARESYEIPKKDDPEYIGLGLSDKQFFNQIIPYLNEIKTNNTPYYGTIITLTNHSPFNDVEKYGEFDLTMPYSYIGEDGNNVDDVANYLEGTSMGNYIKSSHYADEAIGLLFENLKNNNLLENTIFIMYGDHEARLSKKQFNLLYNYDPLNDDIKDKKSEDYYSLDNYNYDLLKNTPLIIWSADKMYKTQVNDVMGMYDVYPTIANMFGIKSTYSLGNDVFSNNEKIVVFPNGNVLTNIIYYNSLNNNYVTFTNDIIDSDYINRISSYAEQIISISNGIITHDLIKNESGKIGECINE